MRRFARSSCVRSAIQASLGSAPSAALACATRLSTVLQVAGIATLGPALRVWHAGSHKISSSNPALVRYLRQRARIIVDPLLGRGRVGVLGGATFRDHLLRGAFGLGAQLLHGGGARGLAPLPCGVGDMFAVIKP